MMFVLGSRIAALRGRLGWSQAELAHRLNVSPSAVGMYEQGRREPSVDMLLSLSRVLGVSMEYLLTGVSCFRKNPPFRQGNSTEGELSLMDSLRHLSRDELLVLLTAELIGSDDS
jgi:transcriptional regulator with XRE-family HTH domain